MSIHVNSAANFSGILVAYHGGTLHGKDVRKLMNDSSDIFTLFADILKANKKEGCKYENSAIDEICKKYETLCVLWDGAFSYASKMNPTAEDITMYLRFVTAAVHAHVELGLNVTPKVHLMWKHVFEQMLLAWMVACGTNTKIGLSGCTK